MKNFFKLKRKLTSHQLNKHLSDLIEINFIRK